MKKTKNQPAHRSEPTIIRVSDIGQRRTPLLTYERAVNDNIPAQQLREAAQWQCAPPRGNHPRGRETRSHLATMADKLEQERGW